MQGLGKASEKNGLADMNLEEINSEINTARAERSMKDEAVEYNTMR